MEHEKFIIEIEGEEASDLYPDLISIEVELDDELACMFRLQIATFPQPDGGWRYLDDERLMIWKQVVIAVGFEDGPEELISGYITHVKPLFDPDPMQCSLEIWGMDSSILMDREEKLKDWPNKKESDIAAEIFGLYGFTPHVDDTEVIHDEAISTIIQRQTDMQFLKKMALRNGFECFVQGTDGYFRRPLTDDAPQPLLAVHFGEDTTVNYFSVEVNALMPANVTMFQLGRMDKEVLEATAVSSQQTALGETDAHGLLAPGMNPGQIFVSKNVATGNPEMDALCRGLFHEAEWFVTGEGEINGNQYGHVLKPRGTVTIKGIAETYSGVYYVCHVKHSITAEGYVQYFRVKRNAIRPTGDEDFSGAGGLLGALI